MPRIKRAEYRVEDPSWVLDGKSLDHCQTATYDPANFTDVASKYKCIPSGYPVRLDARGNITPLAAETDTPDALVARDLSVAPGTGKQAAAVLTHGNVWHRRLPKVIVGGEAKTLVVDDTKKTPLVFIYKEEAN